jgi:aromatic-L-amino-acid/L-tryptophan decarboxylase
MPDPRPSNSLDPTDWTELRCDGHRMLDDMFDHLQSLRGQPVWQQPPDEPTAIREPLPRAPTLLRDVRAQFLESILPYSSGNAHPGFMGWVQGGGTAVGMLA